MEVSGIKCFQCPEVILDRNSVLWRLMKETLHSDRVKLYLSLSVQNFQIRNVKIDPACMWKRCMSHIRTMGNVHFQQWMHIAWWDVFFSPFVRKLTVLTRGSLSGVFLPWWKLFELSLICSYTLHCCGFHAQSQSGSNVQKVQNYLA